MSFSSLSLLCAAVSVLSACSNPCAVSVSRETSPSRRFRTVISALCLSSSDCRFVDNTCPDWIRLCFSFVRPLRTCSNAAISLNNVSTRSCRAAEVRCSSSRWVCTSDKCCSSNAMSLPRVVTFDSSRSRVPKRAVFSWANCIRLSSSTVFCTMSTRFSSCNTVRSPIRAATSFSSSSLSDSSDWCFCSRLSNAPSRVSRCSVNVPRSAVR